MYPTSLTRIAGRATAGTLAAVAAVHGAWATGASWPRGTRGELADLVVGQRPFPGRAACWAVTALLAGSAISVADRAGIRVPVISRWPSITRIGAAATTGALLLRGVAGGVMAVGNLGDVTDEFRRNDRRFYSPLCVALALGAASTLSPSRDLSA